VSGANPDYVRSTHDHLVEMGVVDPVLARISEALAAEAPGPEAPLLAGEG
jgi:cation transport protein ChaC